MRHHHKGKKSCKHNFCCQPQHKSCMYGDMYSQQGMCMPQNGCVKKCKAKQKCKKKCVGTYVTKYKIYETPQQELYKVCAGCHHEYNCHKYNSCPKCGASAEMFVMDSYHGGKHHSKCHKCYKRDADFFYPF